MAKKNPADLPTAADKPWLAKRFSVPFNHDLPSFKDTVVKSYKTLIHSVYMAPPSGLISSARAPMHTVTMQDMRDSISYFASEGIDTYLAINGTWNSPTTYTSENFSILASTLLDLHTSGLTGVIISSSYIANAGFLQQCIPNLKIMPTVNNMFDSFEKAKTATDLIDYSGVVWDRNINPEIEKLEEANRKYKEAFPDKLTAIMLNEGCLRHCPFKRDHDQILSMCSYSDPEYYNYLMAITKRYPQVMTVNGQINTLFGCYQEIKKNKGLRDTIPYIDSLDLQKYDKCADIFKLAGRTHQSVWISSLLKYYVEGKEALPKFMLDSGIGGEYPGGEDKLCTSTQNNQEQI